MHRVSIGNVEVLVISDTVISNNLAEAVPQDAIDIFKRDYAHLLNDRGRLPEPDCCYLIRSAGRTVVVDTGVGNRPRWDWDLGTLDQELQNLGISPNDVDIVVNTHFHEDHVGWNTVDDSNGRPRPFFPRALYKLQQAEWDYWIRPEMTARPGMEHLGQCVQALSQWNVAFVAGDSPITRDLTFVSTPGHTPGHFAIGIQSAGERALIIGDVAHSIAQLDHPDWSSDWDIDPRRAATTRDRVFDRVVNDSSIMMAGHWSFPGAGRIIRLPDRRVFQSL